MIRRLYLIELQVLDNILLQVIASSKASNQTKLALNTIKPEPDAIKPTNKLQFPENVLPKAIPESNGLNLKVQHEKSRLSDNLKSETNNLVRNLRALKNFIGLKEFL